MDNIDDFEKYKPDKYFFIDAFYGKKKYNSKSHIIGTQNKPTKKRKSSSAT